MGSLIGLLCRRDRPDRERSVDDAAASRQHSHHAGGSALPQWSPSRTKQPSPSHHTLEDLASPASEAAEQPPLNQDDADISNKPPADSAEEDRPSLGDALPTEGRNLPTGGNFGAAAALRARLMGAKPAAQTDSMAAARERIEGPRRETVALPLVNSQGRAVPGAFGRERAGAGEPENLMQAT